MKLFDLHCDTIGECYKQGKSLADSDLAISLRKGECLDRWAQLFAVWIPDELRGKAAEEYFDFAAGFFADEIEKSRGKIRLCKGKEDYFKAVSRGECAAFLTVEGGSAAVGAGRLDLLEKIGVKLVTLTWNADNEIGSGCQSDSDAGLTAVGRDFVRELGRRKIIADVSHLNRKGFYEVMSIDTDTPVIASHSDCAEVLRRTRAESEDRFFSLRRALEDEQIKLIIERKGLIGLNFCNSFLGDPGDDGLPALFRHACHIIELGGEDVLAVGSDFDGCEINPDFDSLDKIGNIRSFFAANGFSEELIEKIFYSNAEKFFISVLH